MQETTLTTNHILPVLVVRAAEYLFDQRQQNLRGGWSGPKVQARDGPCSRARRAGWLPALLRFHDEAPTGSTVQVPPRSHDHRAHDEYPHRLQVRVS